MSRHNNIYSKKSYIIDCVVLNCMVLRNKCKGLFYLENHIYTAHSYLLPRMKGIMNLTDSDFMLIHLRKIFQSRWNIPKPVEVDQSEIG